MRAIRKVLAAVFLIAGAFVLSVFSAQVAGVRLGRLEALLDTPAGHAVSLVCAGITALGVICVVVAAFAVRPEPTCVRPGGHPDIEVSLEALSSVARKAAPGEDDVMIEAVEGRVVGRDADEVRLTVEVIAFTDKGLEALARRIQDRVASACEAMLGAGGVAVRVRFLPSKTTIVTKEV